MRERKQKKKEFFGSLEKVRTFELLKNKKGALWLWAVAVLTIMVMAIAWFALTWPTFMLIEKVEGEYNFPAEVQPAIAFIKVVLEWFLILMAFGLLLWIFVNSQRKKDVVYSY